MTPEQCREARLALGMTQTELAGLAGMAQATLGLYERAGHLAPRRIALLRSVLERAGATFPDGPAPATVQEPETISGSQCREARLLLGWSQRQLALAAAHVAPSQVARFEARGDKSYGKRDLSRARKLRAGLEAAGIEFGTEHGRQPGVRLRRLAP
jgi:transcriptional regulator with XRE-family HTH domain